MMIIQQLSPPKRLPRPLPQPLPQPLPNPPNPSPQQQKRRIMIIHQQLPELDPQLLSQPQFVACNSLMFDPPIRYYIVSYERQLVLFPKYMKYFVDRLYFLCFPSLFVYRFQIFHMINRVCVNGGNGIGKKGANNCSL